METQYFHYNHRGWNSFTVAAVLPSATMLKETLTRTGSTTTIPVGIARVFTGNKKKNLRPDNYCKKTGREVAASKLTPVTYELVDVNHTQFDNGIIIARLNEVSGDHTIILRLHQRSDKIHLIDFY